MERVSASLAPADDAASARAFCWNCRAPVEAGAACGECGKIQPLGRDTDYFAVLRLPRKLQIDLHALESVFHERSRQLHPDMFRGASGRERMIALESSALLNQAYRTLRDPFERAAYLVRLEEGDAGGTHGDTSPRGPGELFEEILEIQELLGEFKLADPEDQVTYHPQLATRRDRLQAELDQRAALLTSTLFAEWDALPGSEPDLPLKAPLLKQIRCVLDERAYLRRVLDSLNDALAPGHSARA